MITLVVSETVLLFACYAFAGIWTAYLPLEIFLLDDNGFWRIGLVVAVLVAGLYFSDLYEDFRIKSRLLLVQQTSVMLGIAFVLQAVLSYGRSGLLLPKWMMVYGSSLVLVALPAWRIFFTSFVSKALGSERLLFLGSSQAVREIIAQVSERPDLGLSAIGYIETPEGDADDLPPGAGSSAEPYAGSSYSSTLAPVAPASAICGVPALGTIEDLDAVIAAQHPNRIVVGMTERRNRLPVEQLLHLRFSGIHIEEVTVTFEHIFHRVSTRDLRPSHSFSQPSWGPVPKACCCKTSTPGSWA